MKIVIVIPGLNEEKYIATVLKKVTSLGLPVMYVDDGSVDSSPAIASEYTQHVLHHELNLGKGAALKTGCEYAFNELNADAVIFMDSDNQHDPKELPRFTKLLEDGAPLVYGVRKMGSDMPMLRFLGNKIASIWLNMLFGAYVPDIPSGYKAMTRATYESIKWQSTGYEVEAEIAARSAQQHIPFKVLEIQSIYLDTDKGMTLLDAIRVAQFLLQLRLA
jgi:glycosyltransferase involved in cell wall biosynthesis